MQRTTITIPWSNSSSLPDATALCTLIGMRTTKYRTDTQIAAFRLALFDSNEKAMIQ